MASQLMTPVTPESRFSQDLEAVRSTIHRRLRTARGELYEAASYAFRAEGKMLRPRLVLLTAEAASAGDPPLEFSPVIDFAAAAEMIHVASLIHDDVIDRASSRRSQPSLNHRFSNHTAVLVGDFLFASAFALLAKHAEKGAVSLMTDAIAKMCQGEMRQKEDVFNPDVTEDRYLARIGDKTGALIAACCEGGARLAGADGPTRLLFRRYGHHLGLAFQIIDDVLDWEAESKVLGKPAGSDLIQGVITLPVIRLLAHSHWYRWLTPHLAKRRVDADQIAVIRHAVIHTGTIASSKATARHFADKALAKIASLSNTAAAASLRHLCHQVTSRCR